MKWWGRAVAHAVAAECDLAELSLETLQGFSDRIEEDVYAVLTVEGSVAARDHFWGHRAVPGPRRRGAGSGAPGPGLL